MVKEYEKLLSIFEEHLSVYLQDSTRRRPSELYEPERYILSLGGKRVRPLLSLIACDLFDADPRKALPCALSVELFHNFSLIHDDILDAAPLRRGQPTVHSRYGQNVAILSGDVMLVKAMNSLEAYSDVEYRQLSGLLQRTAVEVCEGQQLDMNFEKTDEVSVADYIEMIGLKTAVLLGCSLQMGAVCAGAGKETGTRIYEFGKHLGIAFQLMDDLLDCFPSSTGFGKKLGGDIAANKKTFLWLKALELGDQTDRAELLRLAESRHPDKITSVLAIFSRLRVDQLCKQEADKHTSLAVETLGKIDCNKNKRKALEQFALYLLNRQS